MQFIHMMVALVYSSGAPNLPPVPVALPFRGTTNECAAGARHRLKVDAGKTYREIWCVTLDPSSGASIALLVKPETAVTQ